MSELVVNEMLFDRLVRKDYDFCPTDLTRGTPLYSKYKAVCFEQNGTEGCEDCIRKLITEDLVKIKGE